MVILKDGGKRLEVDIVHNSRNENLFAELDVREDHAQHLLCYTLVCHVEDPFGELGVGLGLKPLGLDFRIVL